MPASDIERALYEENGRVAATFWEWRYKTMSHFLAVLAALIALATWAADNNVDGFVLVAFTAGSLFSLASFYLNRRARQVLEWCYAIGASIEQRWVPEARRDLGGPCGRQVPAPRGPYFPLATELAAPLNPRKAVATKPGGWTLSSQMTYYRTLNALYLTGAVLMLPTGIVLEFII